MTAEHMVPMTLEEKLALEDLIFNHRLELIEKTELRLKEGNRLEEMIEGRGWIEVEWAIKQYFQAVMGIYEKEVKDD